MGRPHVKHPQACSSLIHPELEHTSAAPGAHHSPHSKLNQAPKAVSITLQQLPAGEEPSEAKSYSGMREGAASSVALGSAGRPRRLGAALAAARPNGAHCSFPVPWSHLGL